MLRPEASSFRESRRIKVARLSALRTGSSYPHEIHLVLISDKNLVDPTDILRPEGLRQRNIPMTITGTEPRAQ
jgi:hypothetical protein